MSASKKNRRRSAFTLIEIMVATVVMIVLVGLVIQITSEVLNAWNRSSGKLSANAQARVAMDLLTQDLETAVMRRNGKQWLRVDAETGVGSPEAGKTVALHLFAPAMDRPSGPGDISAIAYKLAYGPSYRDASFATFALYRRIASPQETFDNIMGIGSESLQEALVGGFWEGSSVVEPENFLAGNITDFKIFVYGVSPTTGEIVAINDEDGNRELDVDYIFGGNGDLGIDPLYAEIVLTVVSDEGLRMLELPTLAGTGYSDVNEIIREHGNVFTRRVSFVSRPF